MMIGILLNMGRHTISRAICTLGLDQKDWSALYRLFERERINLDWIQKVISSHVQEHNGESEPLLAFIDDTLLRKKGLKVHGTSWKLDPLGPKFTNNFIWAQRYMQISLAYKLSDGHCRGIPIAFQHCPVPKKPNSKAEPELWQEYKKLQKEMRLPQKASEEITNLQQSMSKKQIILIGDGGYTNAKVCRNITPNNVYIGRLHKNASLFKSPSIQEIGKGRKKYYGERIPFPEEIRKSMTRWTEVTAYTGNGAHTFKIISVSPIRSKITGNKDVKLLIVQPLRYRLTAHSSLCYRNAAYLLCTDPQMPDEKILQYYLWRWEIELNFKDEKSIFGIHQAQVRTQASVNSFPAFVAATYSLFLLMTPHLVAIYPKWRSQKTIWRPSTNKNIANFRVNTLSAICNKRGFASPTLGNTNPLLFNLLWQNIIRSAAN